MRRILLIMIILNQFEGAPGQYLSPCSVGLLFVILVLQWISPAKFLFQ